MSFPTSQITNLSTSPRHSAKIPSGASPLRRIILFLTIVSASLYACRGTPDASAPPSPAKDSIQITKLPAAYASHKFDPAAPPPNMPPLHPGEAAVCDADFIARSSVRAQPRRTDSTHAMLTVTNVLITLQLETNIWVPADAPQTIVDHEEGHREIAEYYYQTADKLAERIAASYIGKRVDVTGPDLDVALNQKLLEIATEINDAYTKQINSNSTQLLYDDITDHSRNGTIAKDAVDHAIKNAPIEAAPSDAAPAAK
jgi:hypothetical protein